MSVIGLFQPSVLGMESQSHALAATAHNISNLRTGGFKRTDVHFQTVLSETVSTVPGASTSEPASGSTHSDFGGVRPKDYARISLAGQIVPTDRNLDVAISGNGFLTLNTSADGTGQALFGRDGRLELSLPSLGGVPTEEAYLVDKNGYFVQGWERAADGTFPGTNGEPGAIRLDSEHFGPVGEATTNATMTANLPATAEIGDDWTYAVDVFDSAAGRHYVDLTFTKSATRSWDFAVGAEPGDTVTVTPLASFSFTSLPAHTVDFDAAAGTVRLTATASGDPVVDAFAGLSIGDSIDVTGSGAADGTFTIANLTADRSGFTVDPSTPLPAAVTTSLPVAFLRPSASALPLTFGADGYVASPSEYTITIDRAGGTTTAFTLDTSTMTQFGDSTLVSAFERNGYPPGLLESLQFQTDGVITGIFDNGLNAPLYKLAIADFHNPDGLEERNGNVYAESEASGAALIDGAGVDGRGTILANARELSNVDMAQEFDKMIKSQHVYSASALTFRTVDEMIIVARDLKR